MDGRRSRALGDGPPPRCGTVVIGGGQAGLAVGHFLRRAGHGFVILDAAEHVGDARRGRWDSLRLFTPAQYDGLPGLAFPAPRSARPTKDEMADYLHRYATHFDLPVRGSVRVTRLSRADGGFVIDTPAGTMMADRVVVATGTQQAPVVPRFARAVAGDIRQLHSSEYRSATMLPDGEVLVVGCGTSGVEIALDLARAFPNRTIRIAGRPALHVPDALIAYAGAAYWWVIHHIVTLRTPIGRRARPKIRKGGAPLIGISTRDLDFAGIERVPRVVGTDAGGHPRLVDGRVLRPATIIWATGFQPDFAWIDASLRGPDPFWPAESRGVSQTCHGLYFVGLPFQYGLTSGLVGGVGRDAAYVANHLLRACPPRANVATGTLQPALR